MKMKFPKPFKLVMALALAAGLVPIMAAPAQAGIQIEIFPISGPVGTEVYISYYNAYAHAWEWENPAVLPNSTTFGGLPTTHGIGRGIEGAFTIVVPDVPPGDYEIIVTDQNLELRATAIFTVTEGPVVRNPSTIVGHTLERLNGKYERVWGYDTATQTWKVYDSSKSAQPINDLQALERGQTIWIETTEDDVILNWRGTIYFLKKGWNLIDSLGNWDMSKLPLQP